MCRPSPSPPFEFVSLNRVMGGDLRHRVSMSARRTQPGCLLWASRAVERLWAGAAMGREIWAPKLPATRAAPGPGRKSPMGAMIFEARPMVAA